MAHPAARAIGIIDAATELGLTVTGQNAHCFNTSAHARGRDRTPSLRFYADTNTFYCFGCNISGDLITLVRSVLRADFRAACRWIEDRAAGQLLTGRAAPNTPGKAPRRDESSLDVYQYLLSITLPLSLEMPAGRYLNERGIDLDLANQLCCRQRDDASQTWNALLRQFGFERLKSAGLVSRNNHFLFGNHELFFWYLESGVPVYIQARDVAEIAQAKELSLSGLASPVPYNVDLILKSPSYAVLCEGCIDTLSALQMNFPAVGIPGVGGFRSEWFNFFRVLERVVLLFDNDTAGRKQAAELQARFRLQNIKAEAYYPKEVKDINDLLNQFRKEQTNVSAA